MSGRARRERRGRADGQAGSGPHGTLPLRRSRAVRPITGDRRFMQPSRPSADRASGLSPKSAQGIPDRAGFHRPCLHPPGPHNDVITSPSPVIRPSAKSFSSHSTRLGVRNRRRETLSGPKVPGMTGSVTLCELLPSSLGEGHDRCRTADFRTQPTLADARPPLARRPDLDCGGSRRLRRRCGLP